MLKDRMKRIRTESGLTQEKFAERLGLKRNTIATYEIGKSTPIDAVILSICREFGVNEEWLRNGTGEMFIQKSNILVAHAAQLLGKKDPVFEAFVETYSELSPPDREIILNMGMKFLRNLEKYSKDSD